MAVSAKPNAHIPAPRADLSRPADWWDHIADITSGDYDCRTQQYGGNHAAQVVRLNNATSAALTAVLTPEQPGAGTATKSIVINAGSQYEVTVPIKKIVASGSGALSADIFWWFASNSQPNP